MATFPAGMGNARLAGYELGLLDQTIRTDMEVGTARMRRRTKTTLWHVKASWQCDDANLATFQTWFTDTIDGGAAWFDISLAVGQTGIDTVEARFVGPPTVTPLDCNWIVSGTLEVRE